MTALLGTFVKLSTMADGTPRIVMDLQCTLADIAALGLMPGVAFGIARITGESTIAPVEEVPSVASIVEPKTRAGELCIMAATFCKMPVFWEWIRTKEDYCSTESDAKDYILEMCEIESRKELDTNKYAATYFHTLIREPFMAWREAA